MTTQATIEERITIWISKHREALNSKWQAEVRVARLAQDLERAQYQARRLQEMACEENGDESVLVGLEPLLQLQELEHKVQLATLELERVQSEADVRARGMGMKLTDTAVAAQVKSTPQVIAYQRELLNARQEHGRAKLRHEHEMRSARERERTQVREPVEEPEPEEVIRLSAQLAEAEERLEEARVEVRCLRAEGRAFEWLVTVLQAESALNVPFPGRR